MGLWSIITGAGKVGDVIDTGLDLVKTGANGLDKMIYTSEEQAIDRSKDIIANMGHALEFAKLAQNESGASAVTRRMFGLIVLGNFTVFCLVGLVALCLGKINLVKDLVTFAEAIDIGSLTIAVIACTFGYYSITKGRK